MNESIARTAGKILTRAVPTSHAEQTIGELIDEVLAFVGDFDEIDYIYILDGELLSGVLSLHEALCAEKHQSVRSVMITKIASVHSQTDQEVVAHLALAENIKAVPVTDDNRRFIGVVQADTILQILRNEHTEDVLKYAGVNFSASERLANFTLWEHISSRMPWLILGLAGGILAAWVVEQFSHTIAAEVALAAFIPAIVYIADAVGSQTQMVYVRSLMLSSNQSIGKILGRELSVATAVGFTLAGLIGAISWLWLASYSVSTILAIAVLATVYFSVVVGVLLPWLFHRAGKDPALATGPLATVIRDVSSLCIYFLIALQVL